MKKKRFHSRRFILLTVFSIVVSLCVFTANLKAQDLTSLKISKNLVGERHALIIGNSSYTNFSELKNPGQDGSRISARLRDLGFDVTYIEDAGLGRMREAVRSFTDKISGADAALFYYAGHGIQSNGENYLIPVEADIKRESELPSSALSANGVLDQISGVARAPGFSLIVLDACRDNPLARSRSGTRGLSAVSAPSGSIIMYSAEAGEVAYDEILGNGPKTENSPFAQAFIEAISEPGNDISEVYREVASKVKTYTAGKQQPAMYTSFSGIFSFYPLEVAKAQLNNRKVEIEENLSGLNKSIVTLNEQIEQAEDIERREDLMIQRRKAEAKQKQARLERKAIDKREERIADLQRELERKMKQHEEQKSEAKAELAAMRQRVQSRRKELEELSEKVQTISFSNIVDRIFTLEKNLDSIEGDFSSQWKEIKVKMEQKAEEAWEDIRDLPKEPWESEGEYEKRIESEVALFNNTIETDINRMKKEHEKARAEETEKIRTTLGELYRELATREFVIPASKVKLNFDDFDSEKKVFPVSVSSNLQGVPFSKKSAIPVDAYSSSERIEDQFNQFDSLVKSDGIISRITYRAIEENERKWALAVEEIKFVDIVQDRIYSNSVDTTLFWFDPVEQEKYAAKIVVKTSGSQPDSIKLSRGLFYNRQISQGTVYVSEEGSYTVSCTWKTGTAKQKIMLGKGVKENVYIKQPAPAKRLLSLSLPVMMGLSYSFNSIPISLHEGTVDINNTKTPYSLDSNVTHNLIARFGLNYGKVRPKNGGYNGYAIRVYGNIVGNTGSGGPAVTVYNDNNYDVFSLGGEIGIIPHKVISIGRSPWGMLIGLGGGYRVHYYLLRQNSNTSGYNEEDTDHLLFDLCSPVVRGRFVLAWGLGNIFNESNAHKNIFGFSSFGLGIEPFLAYRNGLFWGITFEIGLGELGFTF